MTPEDVDRPAAPRDLDAEAESAPSESFATLERGANRVGECVDSSREVTARALNARDEEGSVKSVLSAVITATVLDDGSSEPRRIAHGDRGADVPDDDDVSGKIMMR